MALNDSLSPPLQVSQWFNTPEPLTLERLRGRVVVMHTFQMLCPGCVSHGVPQALRVHGLFPRDEVAVIGLHTVFEHHAVTGPAALRVFLHEYRIPFPVGIDQADTASPVPLTMQAYGLQGTPSVVVFDPAGRVRLSHFGQIDDLQLGAVIGQLLAEARPQPSLEGAPRPAGVAGGSPCADGACGVDK
ncbi:TlpA family protein disulfide reductase [Ideonella sp. BN130291]|uniref:TlpA family protein disulfide reductase n=1 Tax=Ideonella sp. BN130291 TaxID=3112940 RepID=UPI002E25B9D7|nr:TlpA family protein disulfide reductase [Ideonella sp. BN130291]